MFRIYDISGFQPATAPSGADGIFVKASEGSGYTSAEYNAQMASARGRSKFQGAYHFARPEQSSGTKQARFFLSVAKPKDTDILWNDLEASQLSQAATNEWAIEFGETLKAEVPNKRGLYMGAGYASNGTGRGLNRHYDLWWYPQYPSAYQLMKLPEGVEARAAEEERRAVNRSHATPDRTPIAAMTSSWPPAMTPWLPSGLTCGWSKPDIWQFTDNHGGLDASITLLTLAELVGGGSVPPVSTEEDTWFLGTSS